MKNREILFKGKRVDNNEWEIGYFYHNVEYNKSFIINDSESTEVHPDTVCQFTGLLDKNGNKIFEKDQLFICAGYSSVVDFKDGMFVSVYSHPEDGEIIPLTDAIGKDTEIIHD